VEHSLNELLLRSLVWRTVIILLKCQVHRQLWTQLLEIVILMAKEVCMGTVIDEEVFSWQPKPLR